MAKASNSHNSATQIILRLVEPIIFGKRLITLAVLLVLTAWFGYEASQTKVDAGWLKMVPLQHPYMQTFTEYYKDFGGANTIIVALQNKNGDIYNKEFMDKMQKATDDVFFIPGVDRARVMSIFTPNVTYVEVIEGGLSGANVIPADYAPTPEMFKKIRSNVGKAQIIGRLVSENQDGAMVMAELLEFDPVTNEKLEYQDVADKLEKIREKYEDENTTVHIIGFAKVVGDMTDAATEVVGFFVLALIMTTLLLWAYTGTFKLSLLPMGCSIVAVIWEFGLLTLSGFGVDPFAILVPFLVLSVSVSHGVQYVNAWVAEVDQGKNGYDASVNTFRRLAIPGTVALITDVAGFATIYLIQIDSIQEMSLNAAYGVAAIIITNKVLMPIWLTYMKIGNMEEFRRKQLKREEMGDGLWKIIAKVTHRKPAVAVLLTCSVALGWAIYKYPDLQTGDTLPGVPELRPDSRYNIDSYTIVDNYTLGVDVFKVIAETKPDACIDYPIMEEIDRFSWHMTNTKGVQSVMSLQVLAKLVYSGLSEGRLNAELIPRNRYALAQATALVPTTTGMLNDDCDALALFIFIEDHKADTLKHIVNEVKKFEEANKGTEVTFRLASGNAGVMAATNEVVEAEEVRVVLWVYAVILTFLFLSFRTISGVLCVVLPLSLVSFMAYGVMASLGIGMKVATLPVVALAAGIGVDYGIYIYSELADGLRRGKSLEMAFYETLHKTGKAVIFTGIALGLSVCTWLMSELQFQADMGIMLVFMFTANMFGAILVIPALAHFLSDEEVRKAEKLGLIENTEL